MATVNNGSNQNYANNSDGWQLAGGVTARTLTVTGGNMTMTGTGSNTFTFPAATDTLVGRASTDTLTNKTITSTTNSVSSAILTNPYKFSAYLSSGGQTITANTYTALKCDTTLFDTGSNYNTSTGVFTAPIAGFYQFNIAVRAALGAAGQYIGASFNVGAYTTGNLPTFNGQTFIVGGTGGATAVYSLLVHLTASQTCVAVGYAGVTAFTGGTSTTIASCFNGFLVSVT
jgi:hypothetical protein